MPRARPKPSAPAMPTGQTQTAHARDRGAYEVTRLEKNGPRIAYNAATSPLRIMAMARTVAGPLTEQQREAGETFEALYRFVWSTNRSDILAFKVRGHIHETEAEAEKVRKARELLGRIEAKLPSKGYWTTMVNVCVQQLLLTNSPAHRASYEQLVKGLDITRDVLGI